jgi:predicted enzyme related to lactoylglutathione lyase
VFEEQIAIGTNDVYKTAEAIKLSGGKIIREPGPLPGINTKIVVCLDPDGWKLVWHFSIYLFVCDVLGTLKSSYCVKLSII